MDSRAAKEVLNMVAENIDLKLQVDYYKGAHEQKVREAVFLETERNNLRIDLKQARESYAQLRTELRTAQEELRREQG